jgi:hypothetical protein
MKVPATCPVCYQPMTNEFVTQKRTEILIKKCHQINHHIKYEINLEHNIVCFCEIIIGNKSFVWYPELKFIGKLQHQKIMVYQEGAGLLKLPYFEPEFSNYPALLNKLKTYMVFS